MSKTTSGKVGTVFSSISVNILYSNRGRTLKYEFIAYFHKMKYVPYFP